MQTAGNQVVFLIFCVEQAGLVPLFDRQRRRSDLRQPLVPDSCFLAQFITPFLVYVFQV